MQSSKNHILYLFSIVLCFSKSYSNSTFRDYLSTENGRNIFPAPISGSISTVNIRRQKCTDQTGCPCGNDQGKVGTVHEVLNFYTEVELNLNGSNFQVSSTEIQLLKHWAKLLL